MYRPLKFQKCSQHFIGTHNETLCVVADLLRHNRECEIVTVAAFVVGLEGVITRGNGPAVGQIHESADDRHAARAFDNREGHSDRSSAVLGQGERRCGVNANRIGHHQIGFAGVTTDQAQILCAVAED